MFFDFLLCKLLIVLVFWGYSTIDHTETKISVSKSSQTDKNSDKFWREIIQKHDVGWNCVDKMFSSSEIYNVILRMLVIITLEFWDSEGSVR